MTCAVCGRILADGATRCASCGARAAVAEPSEPFAYTAGTSASPGEPKPDGAFDWYLRAISKFAELDGRATRSEYWYFFLMNIVVSVGLAVLGVLVKSPWLSGLYMLAALVPSFTVMVRRLHDTGRTGWWWLMGFLPLIGGIVLLVFFVQDSDVGPNAYGPNPKTHWT